MAVVLAVHVQPQVLAVPVTVLAVLPVAHKLAVGALVSSAVVPLSCALPQAPVTSVAVRNSTFTTSLPRTPAEDSATK